MKDSTLAAGLYIALGLIVAGIVMYFVADYLGVTESFSNAERVRYQDY